jgi:ligand-binding sensor domain-containing protein
MNTKRFSSIALLTSIPLLLAFYFVAEGSFQRARAQGWKTLIAGPGEIYLHGGGPLLVDQYGKIWVSGLGGCRVSHICIYDGESWTNHSPGDLANGNAVAEGTFLSDPIRQIVEDPTGRILVRSKLYILRFDGQEPEVVASVQTFESQAIRELGGSSWGMPLTMTAMTVDESGVLWVGWIWEGDVLGVSTYNGQRWKTYTYTNSVMPRNGRVIDIAIDSSGIAWISTSKRLVVIGPDRQIVYDSTNSELPYLSTSLEIITSVEIDGLDRVWVLARNGVTLFENGESRGFDYLQAIKLNSQFSFMKLDNDGLPWVGLEPGDLFAYDGNHWSRVTDESGNPCCDSRAISIAFDKQNRAWVGTSYDVRVMNGNEMLLMSQDNFGLDPGAYHMIVIDNQDQVLIASESSINIVSAESSEGLIPAKAYPIRDLWITGGVWFFPLLALGLWICLQLNVWQGAAWALGLGVVGAVLLPRPFFEGVIINPALFGVLLGMIGAIVESRRFGTHRRGILGGILGTLAGVILMSVLLALYVSVAMSIH